MPRLIAACLLLAAAGCAQMPPPQAVPLSACDISETSYDCQVERYSKVSTP